MASVVYSKAKESFLSGAINLTSDTIKAMLVDNADYTFSSAHQFLSDVPILGREEISAAMTSKTVTNGVFDAADVTFTAAAGDPCESIIVFKDTGVVGTSPLIAYIDTATGLPVTLNGGDVTVMWDNGSNKIFAL